MKKPFSLESPLIPLGIVLGSIALGSVWYFNNRIEEEKTKERFKQAQEVKGRVLQGERKTILCPKPFFEEFHYKIKVITEDGSATEFLYKDKYGKHIDELISEGDQITFKEGFRPFDNYTTNSP